MEKLIQDSSFSFEVDVLPARGESNNMASTLIPILVILLIVILAGGDSMFPTKGGSLESIMSKEAVSKITESLNILKKKAVQVLNAGSVVAILLSVKPQLAAVVEPVIIVQVKLGCDILSLGNAYTAMRIGMNQLTHKSRP